MNLHKHEIQTQNMACNYTVNHIAGLIQQCDAYRIENS